MPEGSSSASIGDHRISRPQRNAYLAVSQADIMVSMNNHMQCIRHQLTSSRTPQPFADWLQIIPHSILLPCHHITSFRLPLVSQTTSHSLQSSSLDLKALLIHKACGSYISRSQRTIRKVHQKRPSRQESGTPMLRRYREVSAWIR